MKAKVFNFVMLALIFVLSLQPVLACVDLNEAAVNFTLVDSKGAGYTLSDSVGKIIVVFFLGHN